MEPPDVEDASEAPLVKFLHLLDVSAVWGPRFTTVKEGRQDHSPVDGTFCLRSKSSVISDSFSKASESCTCLCYSVGDFFVKGVIRC